MRAVKQRAGGKVKVQHAVGLLVGRHAAHLQRGLAREAVCAPHPATQHKIVPPLGGVRRLVQAKRLRPVGHAFSQQPQVGFDQCAQKHAAARAIRQDVKEFDAHAVLPVHNAQRGRGYLAQLHHGARQLAFLPHGEAAHGAVDIVPEKPAFDRGGKVGKTADGIAQRHLHDGGLNRLFQIA